MDLSQVFTFTVVAALLVMSPGPNGVLIAKTVPTSGRTAGFANLLGFVSAFYLHGALSILGISIILVQSAVAFAIVKYLGAAYLCWIGIKALWAAYKGSQSSSPVSTIATKRSLLNAYVEGFLTNGLNPKVSMFYLAVFPQFISVAEGSAMSALFLVFIHSMINAVWFGGMILVFSTLAKGAQNPVFQRWLKGVTGVVFIGFGLRLATYRPSL
ncbi:LysE family translocator [Alphaproteobacteria bacterium]|nr:LysE family translocator [Alphaproteobacteria bacterium]